MPIWPGALLALHRRWRLHRPAPLIATPAQPGAGHQRAPPHRPACPCPPARQQVPSPKDSPLALSPHMLHNLAHIELNAIDLAWDTVVRFSHLRLPPPFYEDFARVGGWAGGLLGG
jgi:uncharacterized ferritin-like protein (DUF455 family)